MSGTPDTTAAPTRADPPKDRRGGAVPANISLFLRVIDALFTYGRHLADTLQQRAAAPSFGSLAVRFGTYRLPTILAHLHRGIMRIVALKRVLRARAATGRDLTPVRPNYYQIVTDAPEAEPADGPPAAAAAAAAAALAAQLSAATGAVEQAAAATASDVAPDSRRTAPRQPDRDNPEFYMPSLKELEAQIRRRPFGQTIVDICLDLGVIPEFCCKPLWDELFELIYFYRGNFTTLYRARTRREAAFEREWDRHPASNWKWWELKKGIARQVLGFDIGETPVNPYRSLLTPVAAPTAAATGPP